MTKWQYTNYKGEQVTWYSSDVIDRYKNFLIEIRDLKKSQNINDDVLKMIENFLNEIDEVQNDL